ncbi:MAG: baseplate assembly protein [Phage 64_12]|nr:MAG: baseplate assembly protein [Phage 64_12]
MIDRAEPSRLLGDLIRLGFVVEVAGVRCRVEIDEDFQTDWINMPVARAGRVRTWSPLTEGEQVVLACPEGEIAAAKIIAVVNSDSFPPPATDGRTVMLFDDGCEISYDPDAHRLATTLPDGGVVDLVAPGGLNITGPVKITGDLDVTGTVRGAVDVIAAGISGKGHKHKAVKIGTDQSGDPV